MESLQLKYGCNPNQKPSRVYRDGAGSPCGGLPFKVLNGTPGYINLCDALNGWQLVRELDAATGLPAATSFKHVSPAGAAVGLPLSPVLEKIYFTNGAELSPLACAYVRARGADRMSSFGDFIALSRKCDAATANYIKPLVSDGIIAPTYDEDALEILKAKKKGGYAVLEIDPAYNPDEIEHREIFGITFEQGRNRLNITEELLANVVTDIKNIPDSAKRDLIISLITLKYTQSNSVAYVTDGQAVGIGAGQQSRIHCTRLAGQKADNWRLRQHEKTLNLPFLPTLKLPERDNLTDLYVTEDSEDFASLPWREFFTEKPAPFTKAEKRAFLKAGTGAALGSDAFFPFSDNIERAVQSGVSYIAQPGGSVRDEDVIKSCNAHGIAMAFTGIRLFHH